jgi:hypothetical protein
MSANTTTVKETIKRLGIEVFVVIFDYPLDMCPLSGHFSERSG